MVNQYTPEILARLAKARARGGTRRHYANGRLGQLHLANGEYAKVSLQDYDELILFCWFKIGQMVMRKPKPKLLELDAYYARQGIYLQSIPLGVHILRPDINERVYRMDGQNILNYQRGNLALVPRWEKSSLIGPKVNNKYKGIAVARSKNGYMAKINCLITGEEVAKKFVLQCREKLSYLARTLNSQPSLRTKNSSGKGYQLQAGNKYRVRLYKLFEKDYFAAYAYNQCLLLLPHQKAYLNKIPNQHITTLRTKLDMSDIG